MQIKAENMGWSGYEVSHVYVCTRVCPLAPPTDASSIMEPEQHTIALRSVYIY